MIPLTIEEKELHRNQKVCYIYQKGFSTNDDNGKHHKIRDHFITLENIEELLMIFAI